MKIDKDILFYYSSLEPIILDWQKYERMNHFVPYDYKSGQELESNLVAFSHFNGGKSLKIREKVIDIISIIQPIDVFSDMCNNLISIGIELVQNALVHNDFLENEKNVIMNVYEDDQNFSIEVIDPRGTLKREDVFSQLARAYKEKSFEEKESGAGLGFYLLVHMSDRIEFDIIAGKQTRVKCSIKKYKRLKEYKMKKVSLHFL